MKRQLREIKDKAQTLGRRMPSALPVLVIWSLAGAIAIYAQYLKNNQKITIDNIVEVYAQPQERVSPPTDLQLPVLGKDFERVKFYPQTSTTVRPTIIMVGLIPSEESYAMEMALADHGRELTKDYGIAIAYEAAVGLDRWDHFARLFYTLKELNALNYVSMVYNDIHQNQLKLNSDSDVVTYFENKFQGDHSLAERVMELYHSGQVDAEMKRAERYSYLGGKRNPPYLIINNRYVTSIDMTGSLDRAMKVASSLAVSHEP